MHEVRVPDDQFAAWLRVLSAGSREIAPGHIRERLGAQFRSHHVRRRRKHALRAGLLFVVVAQFPVFFILTDRSPMDDTSRFTGESTVRRQNRHVIAQQGQSFIPIMYGQAMQGEGGAFVVRLRMREAALRLVGLPVSEEAADRSILTDVLVGADGLPYAVRLAANTNTIQGVRQ